MFLCAIDKRLDRELYSDSPNVNLLASVQTTASESRRAALGLKPQRIQELHARQQEMYGWYRVSDLRCLWNNHRQKTNLFGTCRGLSP